MIIYITFELYLIIIIGTDNFKFIIILFELNSESAYIYNCNTKYYILCKCNKVQN